MNYNSGSSVEYIRITCKPPKKKKKYTQPTSEVQNSVFFKMLYLDSDE